MSLMMLILVSMLSLFLDVHVINPQVVEVARILSIYSTTCVRVDKF
jgi:hypothetical protein